LKKMRIQKTGSGQLYVGIPAFIKEHFRLESGQEVFVDIDGDKIVILLRKPTQEVEQTV